MPARLASLFSVASVAVVLLMGGSSGCTSPARSPTVPLRISGGPDSASVTIDDEPVGNFDVVAAHGVALPPGRHRVTVEADGYFPFDRIVDAEPGGEVQRLVIKLEKIPR